MDEQRPKHSEAPPHQATSPLLQELGGYAVLLEIAQEFVRRTRSDTMIGFFFAKVDPQRLAVLEAQFAARALGAAVVYEGRGLRQAHAAHRIADGQFNRRREILRQVLIERQVPAAVAAAWLEHTEKLRSAVTLGPGRGCNHPTGGLLLVEVGADGSETALDWP